MGSRGRHPHLPLSYSAARRPGPHGKGGHAERRRAEWRPLLWACILTFVVLAAEALGGFLTGSLALLSDAAHMLTDAASLTLALVALKVAGRPPTLRKTFGYSRFEILAALLNGLTLWAVVAFIGWEALRRLGEPRAIEVGGMMGVAALGLVANLTAAIILSRSHAGGLNLRGAFLHVLSDVLGSVGTLAAGAIIWLTGWLAADPVVSLLICGLILFSSWSLIRDAVNVLMEGTPAGVDVEAIQRALVAEAGVRGVHDLHVWTVTSGFHALSAHVEVEADRDRERMLRRLNFLLRERFGLTHTTLQIEEPRLPHPGSLQIERGPNRLS